MVRMTALVALAIGCARHDPDPVAVARASLAAGDFAAAARVAEGALDTDRRADAMQVLGAVALARGDLDTAAKWLTDAEAAHRAQHDAKGIIGDAQQLAGVYVAKRDFGAALDAAAAAREGAASLGDPHYLAYAELAIADVRRLLGNLAEAEEHAAAAADAAADRPGDAAIARLHQGWIYLDEAHPGLALAALERALTDETAADARPPMLESLHLNLSLAEAGLHHLDAALAHADAAHALGTDAGAYHLARGRAYLACGKYPEAAAELTAADDGTQRNEWAFEIAVDRARVAAKLGDLDGALRQDAAARAQAAALAARTGDLGPSVAASTRQPHLHAIGIFARQGRWLDALDVLAELDAQFLLASRASPSPAFADLSVGDYKADAPIAPVARPTAAQIAEAWRGRRLVIAVGDGEDLWRIALVDGRASGERVGPAAAFEAAAARLEANPDDTAAGAVVGAAVIPADTPDDAQLDVLLVGPIARAPLPALVVAGRRAGDRWLLARALGVLPAPRAAASGTDRIALADPGGDLPATRAATLRAFPDARIGAAANLAAARAPGLALLHLAAHSHFDAAGWTEVIGLADGDLSATAITAAPALVVLASCASAAGGDDGGHGSLALAFVNAGARTVIATQRTIADADAARVIDRFYAAGGATDPIRALAAIQRAFAGEHDVPRSVWTAFEAIDGRPSGPGPAAAP